MSSKRCFDEISKVNGDVVNLEEEDESKIDEIDALFEACESNNINADVVVASKKLKTSDISSDEIEKKKTEDDLFENLEIPNSPHIKIITLENQQNCTHEIAIPNICEYKPLALPTRKPAKDYPFKLDSFQREAVLCIENNQSVLVSAHTSAGKTVVALYAIAVCLREKQRVIYTSPIKALSNQKYRELQEEFSDVGLMTGDVTLNPDASILVMTTEILRSMLYRGSEILAEVGWVIFDEIHYMRDGERGVVWEETIILLPDNIHYVFLSATIPNARQFAEWVAYLHKQPCHVIYTDYRPTPLQHFIYPCGGNGLFEVVTTTGEFREDKFNSAISILDTAGDAAKEINERGRKGGVKGDSNVCKIIRTILDRDMLPVIVFSFSRKECESYATTLKDMDFNNEKSKKVVQEIFNNAIGLLSEADRQLPQIGQVLPFILRGIGIHHSGLLPIIKETIEILFGEGLIRVLFATETFAMGLNMPARTVLFTAARKFDGKDNRWITSGEYIQMAGRAGRRGKDDRGMVIVMIDQQIKADNLKQMIKGKTDSMDSAFRLTYNMVLNLLRVDGINPEFMLEKSFHQFQNYANIPTYLNDAKNKQAIVEKIKVDHEEDIQSYFEITAKIKQLEKDVAEEIRKPKNIVPFLATGRLVKMKVEKEDFGWGVILDWKKTQKSIENLDPEIIYIVTVGMFVCSRTEHERNVNNLLPPTDPSRSVVISVDTTLDCIESISSIRLKIPETNNDVDDRLKTIGKLLTVALKRFNGKPKLLDPINEMNIKCPQFAKNLENLKAYIHLRDNHKIKKLPNFDELYSQYQAKAKAIEDAKEALEKFKKAKSLLLEEELKKRIVVLRQMKFCKEDGVLTQKGRVACEISAADELVLTEMIFGGVFTELDYKQIAALLSCFVFQENAGQSKLQEELSGCLKTMQEYAKRIYYIERDAGIEKDLTEYVKSFKPQLMDVVHAWASGITFPELLKKTTVFEGSIIRCMRRLEELLRQMTCAAGSMGDKTLAEKFEQARAAIKRDIVFAASLYL
uniref:mRNA transport homolog 4 (inferred by orthology to a C. elegans protein) n=1 Tax=Strongyloides venezuelensis TaxID=75913 RepID=A0A0K0F941_STRVS